MGEWERRRQTVAQDKFMSPWLWALERKSVGLGMCDSCWADGTKSKRNQVLRPNVSLFSKVKLWLGDDYQTILLDHNCHSKSSQNMLARALMKKDTIQRITKAAE